MSDMTPVSRLEYFLAKIIGDDVELPEPQTDVELYLAAVAGETVELPPPASRWTLYLAKILGQNVELPVPQSRADLYLAKLAGEDVELPPMPLTRSEAYLALWADGAGGETLTVTGVAPITLANAIAHAIVSLTQSGKCTQADTPTPSDPVDIKCNNGALRMVDADLPDAYKRVQGFICDNNAMWEIADFHLRGSDTVRISFSVTAACNVFGCYQGVDATDNYDLYASITSGSKYFRYGNGTYLSYFSPANLGQRFDVVYTPTGSTGMPQDSTWSPMTFESARNLLIGSTTAAGTSAKLKGNLYGDFIVESGGVARLHLVPCERVSDNVLGYYDLVGEAFYEPYEGFTGAVSLGYDGSHYVLRTIGTAEVLTVGGQIVDTFTPEHKGYSSSGSPASGDAYVGNREKQRCAGGQTLRVEWSGFEDNPSGVLVSRWDADGNFLARSSAGTISGNGVDYTVPDGVAEINFTLYKSPSIDIPDGATMTVTYWDMSQTASAENLYAVGTYADTQEFISGAISRNVGIKVLDGTENISTSNACFTVAISDKVTTKAPLLCSHFPYSNKTSSQTDDETIIAFASTNIGFRYDACANKTAFAAFLKAQYDAGTPVIVVYPLAEETTESVTGQSLSTNEGTNVVSVTAEVSDITLTAEYKGAA